MDDYRNLSLDDWLDGIPARLYSLQDFELREDVRLDFDVSSLDGVEQVLLERFSAPADLRQPGVEPFVGGVIAYLGETLLRLAGGGWRVEDSDSPLIEADSELGLRAVSPFGLLVEAVRARSGRQLRGAYAAWERAVAVYRAAHPTWSPVKRPTPGLDPIVFEDSEVRYLQTWLAERQLAFPGWVATYGQGASWDFSPESLDALGALVLRLTPTVEDLDDEGNAAFVEGAIWYLGEALRRVQGGRWCYRDGDPEVNLFEGHPYVEQLGEHAASGVPFYAVRVLVQRGDPDHLRRRYETFATRRGTAG